MIQVSVHLFMNAKRNAGVVMEGYYWVHNDHQSSVME